MLVRASILEQLEQQGYTDVELLGYANQWITSNERMDVPTEQAVEMLETSRGFRYFEKFGQVPEDDD